MLICSFTVEEPLPRYIKDSVKMRPQEQSRDSCHKQQTWAKVIP